MSETEAEAKAAFARIWKEAAGVDPDMPSHVAAELIASREKLRARKKVLEETQARLWQLEAENPRRWWRMFCVSTALNVVMLVSFLVAVTM